MVTADCFPGAHAARKLIAGLLLVGTLAACGNNVTSSPPSSTLVVQTTGATENTGADLATTTTTSVPVATTLPPRDTVPAAVGVSGPSASEAFVELRADEDGEIVRWYENLLTVGVAGAPTETDLYTLERYVETVADMAGVPELEIVDDGATDADIVVHFLPKDRWRDAIDDADVGPEVDGQARYRQVDGEITGVTIVVNSLSDQLQRNRTIVHEMLHAYGLGHHSCPGGLLYSGSDYEPEWRFSEYDRVLLAAWYTEHAGEPQVATDLPCPAVVWRTVTFDGTRLWCRRDSGACHEVDERRGVETSGDPFGWYVDGGIVLYDPNRYIAFSSKDGPVLCLLDDQAYRPCQVDATREIERPDRWYDGKSLYDYNPETHLVRIFEGRRLLCEKPGANRTPCQFTEGQELTGVDVYTDGEFVYQTP